MEMFIHSHSLALFLIARGNWPVDYDGESFVFNGHTLDRDVRAYMEARGTLNALRDSRAVERAT